MPSTNGSRSLQIAACQGTSLTSSSSSLKDVSPYPRLRFCGQFPPPIKDFNLENVYRYFKGDLSSGRLQPVTTKRTKVTSPIPWSQLSLNPTSPFLFQISHKGLVSTSAEVNVSASRCFGATLHSCIASRTPREPFSCTLFYRKFTPFNLLKLN